MFRCGLGCDVDGPQARAGGGAFAMENGCAVVVSDGEARFGEGGRAPSIAQLADADEAVCEAWDYVAGARLCGRQCLQGKLCGCCGRVGCTSGGADGDALAVGVDVGDWGGGGEVMIRGSGIGDGEV